MIFFVRHKTWTIFLFAYKNILWIIPKTKAGFFAKFGVVKMPVCDRLTLVKAQCIPAVLRKYYNHLFNPIYLPLSSKGRVFYEIWSSKNACLRSLNVSQNTVYSTNVA